MEKLKIKDILYFLGVLFAIGFWLFTMYGLPPRVDKLERDVSTLEKTVIAEEVKTDMIFQSVTRIENLLLNKGK